MATKRSKKSVGPANQAQVRFNDKANSDKTSESGFDYSAGILGAIGTAQKCGANKQVMVCNVGAAAHYVKFGDASVAAPTGLSDGIYVPPASCVVLASGSNTYVRSDSADVGAYVAYDDIEES